MKIVINSCYGGFSLSHEAVLAYAKRKGITLYFENELNFLTHYYTIPIKEYNALQDDEEQNKHYFSCRYIERNDPDLVAVVEELGNKANGSHAELRIVEIPDDVDWDIDEYDGREHVEEKHRTWH